jgi:SPP1 gp7 family putative phage head morphogenesis protein
VSVFVPDLRRVPTLEVVPVEKAVLKAGPAGPGGYVLQTEYPLAGFFGNKDPRRRIRQAWQMGIQVPWIRAAERVITDLASTATWHLEDENDEEIDDTNGDPDAQRIQRLLEQPQANLAVGRKMTGREMKALTIRHMGLCGVAFWYKDETDGMGIPRSFLYIRPDRMWPVEDGNGNLIDWSLDADSMGKGGTLLGLDNVLQFNLQPPDEGHIGVGLVESALLKAQLTMSTDQHAASVLSAGGRVAGIISPKTGSIDNDGIYDQMVLDARTITEQPDAAKRLQIIRAPVDFTSTMMTMDQAKIVDMMDKTRDALLALWGVPPSQIGITESRGLNSGQAQNYEEAALWQNAIHPRLVTFQEVIQFQWLDTIKATTVELEIEEPEFDDQAPKYALLNQSVNAPLRNIERRAIIGLDPFGDDVVGLSGVPLDDEVWLPATMVQAYTAPTEPSTATIPAPAAPSPATATPEGASAQAGDTSQLGTPAKASGPKSAGIRSSMTKLRASVDRNMTPRMKRDVAALLREQLADVTKRIREHAAHVMAKPHETDIWWTAKRWDAAMAGTLKPHMAGIAKTVNGAVEAVLPPQKAAADPVVDRILLKGAARVTDINATTRDAIAAIIADGVESDASLNEIIDSIEAGAMFDEYRSELIARTELMFAYNASAIESYRDGGVQMLEAIDGDGDPECAERDGQTFSVDEADGIDDHPNGTLDWVPVFEGDVSEAPLEEKATTIHLVYDTEGRVVQIIER